MKNITILVPEGAVLASIADPRYMFTAANEMLRNTGKKEMFSVKLASLRSDVTLSDGTATIHPDAAIADIKKTDLVIIPALGR
ncbi:MAG TPA: AraC family transcriptional regulator, partial [Ignavibacteria bacterium]|nr:AraC family transcriptional regulator [Ignavibacteria bacterium]